MGYSSPHEGQRSIKIPAHKTSTSVDVWLWMEAGAPHFAQMIRVT